MSGYDNMDWWEDWEEQINNNLKLARSILPGWFVDRMMTDHWYFGLMMSDGSVITISEIVRVYVDVNGGIWIDAYMVDDDIDINPAIKTDRQRHYFTAPAPSRTMISLNATHIMAAFDMGES